MDAINYTTARKSLAVTMEKVCNDRNPVIITKNSECAVVMMPLDDYEAIAETEYLLRSPANAKMIKKALKQSANGEGRKMSMAEIEAL